MAGDPETPSAANPPENNERRSRPCRRGNWRPATPWLFGAAAGRRSGGISARDGATAVAAVVVVVAVVAIAIVVVDVVFGL